MDRLNRRCCAIVGLLLASGWAGAQNLDARSAGARDSGSASAERGYRLYMEKMCYTCHGTVGQGGERGTGPRVAPTAWPYEAFAQQVRHPRQDMPRYAEKFVSDAELADIYAYVRSIAPGRPAREIELLSTAP